MRPRIIAVIQARLASTRLPYKVLRSVAGKPMLQHVLERARAITAISDVILTTPEEDAPICRLLEPRWVPHAPPDVLSGFVRAAHDYQADQILRITGDCPLVPVDLAHWVCLEFNFFPRPCHFAPDYLGTTRPLLAYPDGFDLEIITTEALDIADREAMGDDREHVTSFIWRQPDRFKIGQFTPLSDAWALGLKLSVDTQEDLDRASRIMAKIPAGDFSMAATLHAAQEVEHETSDHDL